MRKNGIGSPHPRRRGGFTLIEMLIVVAIIAVLAAVSIPMVNTSLEKARRATDDANERAAKAAAMIAYLTEGGNENGLNCYYYRDDGTVTEREDLTLPTIPAGTDGYDYGQSTGHKNGCVMVNINLAGDTVTVIADWETPK